MLFKDTMVLEKHFGYPSLDIYFSDFCQSESPGSGWTSKIVTVTALTQSAFFESEGIVSGLSIQAVQFRIRFGNFPFGSLCPI